MFVKYILKKNNHHLIPRICNSQNSINSWAPWSESWQVSSDGAGMKKIICQRILETDMRILASLTSSPQENQHLRLYCVEPVTTVTPCGSERQMQAKEVLGAERSGDRDLELKATSKTGDHEFLLSQWVLKNELSNKRDTAILVPWVSEAFCIRWYYHVLRLVAHSTVFDIWTISSV